MEIIICVNGQIDLNEISERQERFPNLKMSVIWGDASHPFNSMSRPAVSLIAAITLARRNDGVGVKFTPGIGWQVW